ncbi:hypothetical protein [Natronorarus salvus]|uniref:hypothetical protein n=1 Tax=Natronorarus salvus TaxID=3117733 RepID=UPI002F265409
MAGSVGLAEDATNESTPDHRHPEEVDEHGDDAAVSAWLRERLESSLEESSIRLSEGEYEEARELIGDDYDATLEQYAEVLDEDDRQAAKEIESARDDQRNLTDDVERYDRLYEEYQEARDEGDQQRALELARELESLSSSIEERSRSLDERYESMSERTGTDMSTERETVDTIRSSVVDRQSEVREEEFDETVLDLDGTPTEASFSEPMTLSGSLTTETGEPVANEEIVLAIDHDERAPDQPRQTLSATTDGAGSFDVEYRPTTLPLNVTEIDVEYLPESGSPYAGSSASVPIDPTQTDADLEITAVNESVAFGDELVVDGTVRAGGLEAEADAVPVTVTLDGQTIAESYTDETGSFSANGTVPTNVPVGDTEVQATVSQQDRTLSSATESETIAIEETPAGLTLTAEPVAEDRLYIHGRLTTAEGIALAEQPIVIAIGEQSTTVRTDENGEYEATITVPEEAGSSVTVTAYYGEEGTNIADEEAEIVLELGGGDGVGPLGRVLGVPLDESTITAGALTVILLGSGGWLLFRRRDQEGREPVETAPHEPDSSSDMRGEISRSLLVFARENLDRGDEHRAVEAAYVAARQRIDHGSNALTHWEFYDVCRSNGLEAEEVDRLKSLTERFERAAFSPAVIARSDAEGAIDDAESLVS